MYAGLFDYYIKKQGKLGFNEKDGNLERYLAHIDELSRYLEVAKQYLNKDKIRQEVIIKHPGYTGYEDGTLFFYHYESFANYLYSFKEAWLEFLRLYFDIDKSIKKICSHNNLI